MSRLPIVAIIGRPNTGKSTLFNRLIGQRKAIVSVVPGTTRDRISHRVMSEGGQEYLLLDTGGIGATRDKEFELDVARQSMIALEQADVIILTVNSKEPITSDDRKVIELLRKKGRKNVPVIVVLTKADNPLTHEEILLDFQEINIGQEFLALSAAHNLRIDELGASLEKYLKKMETKESKETKETDDNQKLKTKNQKLHEESEKLPIQPRIAIVGRPNVGKSSIINALMSESQRETSPLLVSPIAGTTRDAVDTEIRYHEKIYVLVDTAGLKKKSQTREELEIYSMMRAITAIESSDMVLMVLDAADPVTRQDKRIAALSIQSGKGLLILLNKIDMLKGEERKKKLAEIIALLNFARFARVIPVSAKTREGLLKIFDFIEIISSNRSRRLASRELRNWFEDTVYGRPAGEITKAKHITQAAEIPPTFVIFVKNPKLVKVSDLRFLENRMRETFGFEGVPVRWVTKKTGERRDSDER